MSIEQDRAFYERRLSEEQARASQANDEKLRYLHLHWASLYESRLALLAARSKCVSRPDERVTAFDEQVRQHP